jgi:hypothetical protein
MQTITIVPNSGQWKELASLMSVNVPVRKGLPKVNTLAETFYFGGYYSALDSCKIEEIKPGIFKLTFFRYKFLKFYIFSSNAPEFAKTFERACKYALHILRKIDLNNPRKVNVLFHNN